MRKFCIIGMMMIAAGLMQVGCGEQLDDDPYAIDIFYDPGSSSTNCCGIDYSATITGVSQSGGKYYTLALMQDQNVLVYGDSKFIDSGSYTDVIINLPVSYIDSINAGDYVIQAIASDEPMIFGLENPITISKAEILSLSTLSGSGCDTCCTGGGILRWYCGVIMREVRISGIKAKAKARYGQHCGYPLSIKKSETNFFVNLSTALTTTSDSINAFAQLGVHNTRLEGSTSPNDRSNYWEIVTPQGEYDRGDFIYTTPAEGETIDFKIVYDESSHKFQFHLNDDFSFSVTETGFNNHLLSFGHWITEITHRESDMPGIQNPGSRFQFINCEYKVGSGFYQDLVYDSNDDNIGCSGTSGLEWGINIDGNLIEVWDIYPLQ